MLKPKKPNLMKSKPTKILKRNGAVVPFNEEKITEAISKAIVATGEGQDIKLAKKVSKKVMSALGSKFGKRSVPGVEDVQDIVEDSLIKEGLSSVAKSYILYRSGRAKVREARNMIPGKVQQLARESKKYFKNDFAEFIYYRTYSRWIESEGRRETWIETVDRYVDFMKENLGKSLTDEEYQEVRSAILRQEVMPSMRLMWSAGDAARKSNVSAYNCSFIAPSRLEDFAEIIYLLMCGAGVGFSVESQTVQQLPIIEFQSNGGSLARFVGVSARRDGGRSNGKSSTYIVDDSKEGWGDALTFGLKTWYGGKDVTFDYSKLRPAGARLNTMGGRSSGPEPLRALLDFSREKILSRQGKRLSNLDVHDIICKIGEVVVMGGVRRSALISLSDLDDKDMRHAKEGRFYMFEPQRQMANNSAVYNHRPTTTEFMEEWLSLAKGGTGERGIFNRAGLKQQLPERRWKKFWKYWPTSGTNPCGEIVLRSKQFCNLSEVVCRSEDTRDSLLRKVRIAAILGTYQSTLTKFSYLSKEWKYNCNEERLLGVSLTGQWDSSAVRDKETLRSLRDYAVKINQEYSKRFGINASTCVTCVKPSGTVSQLVDAASGMHARHSKYYIRRVRISSSDPLFSMMRDQKFPYFPEVGQPLHTASTYVFEFPIKSPKDAVTRNDLSAFDQLEHWKDVKEAYTEHNPSVTISVGEGEWIETANWIYKRWDMLGGLSFLPRSDHTYTLAPYEEISEERYNEMVSKMPKIDFSQILTYEKEDHTQGAKELACVAGVCEIEEVTTSSGQ